MKEDFKVKDLGIATWLLDMYKQYKNDSIVLSQGSYIKKMLKRFKMDMSRSISTSLDVRVKVIKGTIKEQLDNSTNYQLIIGSLLYAVTGT